jgi:hypothetical protein
VLAKKRKNPSLNEEEELDEEKEEVEEVEDEESEDEEEGVEEHDEGIRGRTKWKNKENEKGK